MANTGDTGGHRPTKAERKEQARIDRERIQSQMASKRRNRNIGLALIALAAVAIVVVVFVIQPGASSTKIPSTK